MSSKKTPAGLPEQAEAAEPQSRKEKALVGLMVAGMFLGGFVLLVAGGTFAYNQGLPMFVVGIIAIAVLAGVFSLLRRWADRVDQDAQA